MGEEEAKKRLTMIAKKQELLSKAVGVLQERLFEAVLNQIETIAEDPATMNRLFDEFTANEHSKVLQNFARDIISIGQLNAEYFIEAAANIGAKDYQAIQSKANDQILNRFGLSKEGKMLKGGFIDSFANDPTIKRELTQYAYKAKTSGVGLQEFKKGFKELIVGEEGKKGKLERYYQQFSYDTYQQVDATLQQTYSEELGIQAWLYLGGLVAGSRPFCIERQGKVFIKNEIEAWANIDFAGKLSNYNPFLDRGGANCRHQLNAVTPKMAIARRSDLEIDEDGRLRVKGTVKEEFREAKTIEEAESYAEKLGFKYTHNKEDIIEGLATNYAKDSTASTAKDAYHYERMYNDSYTRSKKDYQSDFKNENYAEFEPSEKLRIMNSINKAVAKTGDRLDVFLIDESINNKQAALAEYFEGATLETSYIKVSNAYALKKTHKVESFLDEWKTVAPSMYDDFIEGAYNHEYGHHYDLFVNKGKLSGDAKTYFKENQDYIEKNLTMYAAEKPTEAIAEAWATFRNPKYKDFPEATRELVERLLKK